LTSAIELPSPPLADDRCASWHCRSARFSWGFRLFLLVNALLFIRPAEIGPAFAGWPIYEVAIILCVLLSLPVILRQLSISSLRTNPVTVCVLLLLPAIALSSLSHFDTWSARTGAVEFIKVIVYYLLLVGLVDSPKRLRVFLMVITLLVLSLAAVCVLNYHGIVDVPALEVLKQDQYSDTGDVSAVLRLQALGIFSDPNDFCLVLVTGLLVVLHLIVGAHRWVARLAWMPALLLLGYAFALTGSRGGLLALGAGIAVLAVARWGFRSVYLLVPAVALVLILFGGRQTDISLDKDDTAMGRVLLWRDALVLFHHSPILGIGYGRLSDEIGMVAHNSYVHSFAEMGFVGGTVFVGAVYFLIVGLALCRRTERETLHPLSIPQNPVLVELLGWRVIVLAIVCAYATGLLSLSRTYTASTYLPVGVGAAFLKMSHEYGLSTLPARPVRKLLTVSVLSILFLEVFVRVVTRL
jgi:O-antigen ligase